MRAPDVDDRARRPRMERVPGFNLPLPAAQESELARAFDPTTLDLVLRFAGQVPLGPPRHANVLVNAAPRSGSSFVFALVKYGPGHASTTIEQLEHERNREDIKFKRGVTGRWAAEATERQKARLREIAALHPGSDFGLD